MSRETTPRFGSIVTAAPGELHGAFGLIPPTAATRELVLDKSAAELSRLHFTRTILEEALEGRTLSLVPGVDVGHGAGARAGKQFVVKIDPPLRADEAPAWAGLQGQVKKVASSGFFSHDNSKMQCRSFALPAGCPEIGGSCIGASSGQVLGGRYKADGSVLDRAGRAHKLVVVPERAICGSCYGTGGSFANGSVQLDELVRFKLLHKLSRADMALAISTALHAEKAAGGWAKEGRYYYFRVHDSGDFFSKDYARAWFDAAFEHPDVLFWAPTRTHVISGWRDFWRDEAANRPENFIVRPSAYHFDDPAPFVPGCNPGTTSLYELHAPDGTRSAVVDPVRAVWNCRVYDATGKDARNCLAAMSPTADGKPSGKIGCRACWTTDLTINYTAH